MGAPDAGDATASEEVPDMDTEARRALVGEVPLQSALQVVVAEDMGGHRRKLGDMVEDAHTEEVGVVVELLQLPPPPAVAAAVAIEVFA